ncbi:hypothetical protein IQ07DRAFT_356039 [Pyrenochaeta sp. DS3sAY3a]|nr:hypothetical protein IQ07DRAFT_356039 [Pyrenochaeta sp. DS3sAY3a]
MRRWRVNMWVCWMVPQAPASVLSLHVIATWGRDPACGKVCSLARIPLVQLFKLSHQNLGRKAVVVVSGLV